MEVLATGSLALVMEKADYPRFKVTDTIINMYTADEPCEANVANVVYL